MGKFLDYDGITYVINKLKTLINEKANLIHIHGANDITETEIKNFVTSDEKVKISALDTSGDGTQFLSNDGTYQPANSSILITDGDGSKYLADNGLYSPIDISATIDDEIISNTSTFSSEKIQAELDLKAEELDLHFHSNKNILDDITIERYTQWEEKTNMIISNGSGNNFFADDGSYKPIEGISNPINDSDLTSTTTTLSASKINSQMTTAIETLDDELTQQINGKIDAVVGKGLSTNDYSDVDKNKVALMKSNGSSNEFFAKDGEYYVIDNVGINNLNSGDNTTFSGNEIDKRINDGILNLVLPTQNDAPTMWKKNYENVTTGQVLEMQTSLNFNINNAIIQVYKFVDGALNVEKTISDFKVSEQNDYIYNPDNILFDEVLKIKDSYSIPLIVNDDGYYETQSIISKEDYIDINNISITVR